MMTDILKTAKEALEIEAQAILDQIENLGPDFEMAVQTIAASQGKVLVTGMGKSGIIGKKISATLASTGTRSFFMHPGEAYHGDLGMVAPDDTVLALSNSGETDEILKILPFFKDNSNKVISITGNAQSTLARFSDIHLLLTIKQEACPLSLAPTSSTTATLAMGDALAITLMKVNDFKPENFARFHPGGSLGRKLLCKAKDIMRTEELPIVSPEDSITKILFEITRTKMGLSVVVENGKVIGLVTDGDIRRNMEKYKKEVFDFSAADIMTKAPKAIGIEASISEIEALMKLHNLHSLLVTNELKELMGIVEINDTNL
ncbi:KpsF/GutQ family sugar-phosphate isomerase [uncultured Imperialibacter sp.]|uniref:KpsF/GutQ family sugar-phosphate isomerase n=1 Tax=uncultured Imperialibacter sp. TaxID=1672639 RepID=UPI0030D9FB1C|tara:strand:+ start:9871 stop:10824 length:954 start_codon:yes stop_codon:yes gene_type:complete